jgi:HEAT repeat protein
LEIRTCWTSTCSSMCLLKWINWSVSKSCLSIYTHRKSDTLPAIPLLVNLFKNTQNWLVRQSIISLLLDTNYDAELLATAELAIADETQSVKEVGILALGHLLNSPVGARALSLLLELCQDPSWRNRWRATIALQSLQNPATKAAIARMQLDEHFRVVAAALEVANHWASRPD